jgi:hypothetical protein
LDLRRAWRWKSRDILDEIWPRKGNRQLAQHQSLESAPQQVQQKPHPVVRDDSLVGKQPKDVRARNVSHEKLVPKQIKFETNNPLQQEIQFHNRNHIDSSLELLRFARSDDISNRPTYYY